MTYDTQANHQLNQEHSVNTLPYRPSVQNQNTGVQHEQVPALSETDMFANNNYDQTVTHDHDTFRSALTACTSTSANRFASDHKSFHGGHTNPNTDRISQPRRNYDAATRNRHRYSTKNVYVKHVPNNWMLNGIQNVIHHLHEF